MCLPRPASESAWTCGWCMPPPEFPLIGDRPIPRRRPEPQPTGPSTWDPKVGRTAAPLAQQAYPASRCSRSSSTKRSINSEWPVTWKM